MKVQYKLRTYEINPYQIKILNEIKSLPQKRLHYLVVQQSSVQKNLTLRELKKLIRRGIKRYFENTEMYYQKGLEYRLVKFFCVFETKKDFFQSQHQNTIVDEVIDMGIHFHLFITSPDNYPWVSFPSLFHQILMELTSLNHKRFCISKFDYNRVEKINDDFILYHTKQFMYRDSVEMVMKNTS